MPSNVIIPPSPILKLLLPFSLSIVIKDFSAFEMFLILKLIFEEPDSSKIVCFAPKSLKIYPAKPKLQA